MAASLAWSGFGSTRTSCTSERGIDRVDVRNDRRTCTSQNSSVSVAPSTEHAMRRCASVLTRTRLPGLRFSTARQSPVCASTLAAKNNTEMAQTTICLFRREGNAARRTIHAVRKTLRNSLQFISFSCKRDVQGSILRSIGKKEAQPGLLTFRTLTGGGGNSVSVSSYPRLPGL